MGIARSSLKLFIARATTTVIYFIGITYFARELGASQMGVFFLFQTVLGFLGISAGFGIQGGVEKRISEGKNPDSVFATSLLMLIISISVISAIILIFQDYLNSYIGGEVAMYIMIGLFLQQMGKLMLKVLNGELRVGDTAIIRFSKKLTWVGAGAVFVLLGFDYYGLVYGVLFGSAMTFIFAWYRKSIPLGKPSIKSARSIFDYSKYSFISSIGGYFYSWMDVAILGIFLSQSHIGAYEMAWRVTTIVMLLSSSIATSIFPHVSKWDSKDSYKKIENILPEAMTPALLLSIPAFFGTVVLSKEILGLVFGEEYTIAWIALIILMGEKLLQSVHIILGRSLQAINRPDLAAKSGIIAIIINLVLNIFFIWEFGLVGAAVATAVSFIVNSILHAHYLSQFIKIRFETKKILWSLASALIMTGVLIPIKLIYGVNNVIQLGMVISLGVIVYSIVLFLSSRIRTDAINMAQNL